MKDHLKQGYGGYMSSASAISGNGGDLGEVQIAMLKKAQDNEGAAATKLIQNIPQAPAPRAASQAGVGTKADFTA